MKWLPRAIGVVLILLALLTLAGYWTFIKPHTFDRDAAYQSRMHHLWQGIPDAARRFNWDWEVESDVNWLFSALVNPFMEDGPYLVAYSLTEKQPTAAILVLPGGGYAFRSELLEGIEIAEWLNRQGIAAFILNYRLQQHPAPLNDAKLAMRYLRHNAGQFGIDVDRIGVMGFSAGGHLAASLSTLYDIDSSEDDLPLPPEGYSSRPDFAVLAYPVISFGKFSNQGSRDKLIGENADSALIELLSTEKQVDAETPPAFIWAPQTDTVVAYENAVLYAEALKAAGVASELHIFPEGRHGSALAVDEPYAAAWPGLMLDWLQKQHFR